MRLFHTPGYPAAPAAGRGFDAVVAGPWPRRLAALATWLLVFGCAQVGTRLVLHLFASVREVPAGARPVALRGVGELAQQASRLFATGAAPRAEAPRRFRLLGVIGGGRAAGAALIGVDGRPPRAYPVGAEIAPGVRLVSTGFGSVEIELDGSVRVLDSEQAGEGSAATAPARN